MKIFPKESKWYGWLAAILTVSLGLQILTGCDPTTPPAPTAEEGPVMSYEELMLELRKAREELENIKKLQRQYHNGTLKAA
jgi:uncharacterized caspase-like protein